MTTIREKAEQAERDIHLTGDMAYSTYRLESKELSPADEISDDGQFPQFGDFADVTIPTNGDGDDPELWAEICSSLAQSLVEQELGEGDIFRVGPTEKVDGEWRVDVKPASERDSQNPDR